MAVSTRVGTISGSAALPSASCRFLFLENRRYAIPLRNCFLYVLVELWVRCVAALFIIVSVVWDSTEDFLLEQLTLPPTRVGKQYGLDAGQSASLPQWPLLTSPAFLTKGTTSSTSALSVTGRRPCSTDMSKKLYATGEESGGWVAYLMACRSTRAPVCAAATVCISGAVAPTS